MKRVEKLKLKPKRYTKERTWAEQLRSLVVGRDMLVVDGAGLIKSVRNCISVVLIDDRANGRRWTTQVDVAKNKCYVWRTA